MTWTIRQEKPGDEAAIGQVIAAAFAGKPYADGREADLPEQLRAAGALVLSLVAVQKGRIVGQVALSPAKLGETQMLCLGPLAVVPELQGKGIGTKLVSHALAVAEAYGRAGVLLMGDPGYYGRFGFRKLPDVTYAGNGEEFIQVLPFGDAALSGEVRFHPVFG